MEVIVIVRGECEMIQERIDPISRKAQAFRVGRFGPNSILSSAEYVRLVDCHNLIVIVWIGPVPGSSLT